MAEKRTPSPNQKPPTSKGRAAPSSTSKSSTPRVKSQPAATPKPAAKRTPTTTPRTGTSTSRSPSRSTPGRTTRSSRAVVEPAGPSFLERVRDFLSDPNLFRKLQGQLPSWSDEAGAFALIILGVLTLSTLFSPSGDIAAPLATGLRHAFGNGAYLVALTVMALGIIMLLPKAGIYIRFNWTRILALEIIFLSLQGLFHLLAFEPETRALAREGQGGGYVGWAISSLLAAPFGTWISIFLLSSFAVIGMAMVLGIQRQDVRRGLLSLSEQMKATAVRLRPEPDSTPLPSAPPPPVPVAKPVVDVAAKAALAAAVADEVRQTIAPAKETAPPPPQPVVAPRPPRTPPPPPPASQSEAPAPTARRAPPRTTAARTELSAPPRRTPMPPPPTPAPTVPPAPVQPIQSIPISSEALPATQRPWEMPPPADAPSTPPRKSNGPAVPPPGWSLDDVLDDNLEVENDDDSDEVVGYIRPDEGQAPRLIINGQVITPPSPGDRPSVVPRDDRPSIAPVRPAIPRPSGNLGERAEPRRHFVVDGYQDKVKIGKRSKVLPPLEQLTYSDLKLPGEQEVNTNAEIIERTLLEFDVDADVIDVRVGPSVTQYAVSPIKEVINEQGETTIIRTRVSKIAALASDLALALSTKTLRIEAPVPGHSYVGIEVPNSEPSIVSLRSVMESEIFFNERKKPLAVPLGRDVSGEPVVVNLALMPHLLVAGTTGSGKSVFLRSLITSLIMNNTPDQLRLIILDPKMVEFTQFNGIPHLLGPVETDTERIIGVLRWAAREMDRRYKLLELEKARNIEAYNEVVGRRRRTEQMPYIVLVVDEIGDLMMMRPDETEKTLTRLAQKARAAGMHLVVATQRPSVDVITGLIKANFPARISFAVAAGVDSRVILDTVGAETLVGRGDMLFLGPDAAGPKRVQGCYVSDQEVDAVVHYWRNWHHEMIAQEKMEPPDAIAPWETALTRLEELSLMDPVLEEALSLVVSEKQASVSLLQRRLGVGYPRAAHLMDSLYELGIIGSPRAGGKSREVLVKSVDEARRMVAKNRRQKLY